MWTKQVTDMIIAGVGETLYMTLFSTFFWICVWNASWHFAEGIGQRGPAAKCSFI